MKETLARQRDERTAETKTVREKRGNLTEADLLPGDHICARRTSRFYTHHGIYMGDGKVIHVTGSIREKVDPEVRETDLSTFLKGGTLKRRQYKVRLPPSETIRIAKRHISDKSYSMIWNNCEHFATYCATGKRKSRQVRRALSGLSTVAAGVIVVVVARLVSSMLRRW
ncbi:MAG: lecithin retinol acyltransferase family protein [Desulfobacterales bacterium]|nr:lecithin retinol acyltransferase family protein [Desulfobacterales bacterium]